jgi:outer membrane lipoprotein SlyB
MGRKLAIATFVGLFACLSAFADTITMKDGTTHEGTLVSATSSTISFRTNGTLHRYQRSSVESINITNPQSASSEGFSQRGSQHAQNTGPVTVPAGTEIAVLTNQNIDSKDANSGQTYSADIANNITDSNGRVVIPKGSPAQLVLRDLKSGGVAGTKEMTLDLQSIKVGDKRYNVDTADLTQSSRQGIGANKRTAEFVGGGTVLGTLIGAAAGGGKGAAIGAISGAAAGAGTQILTRGKAVNVPAESTLRFRLDEPLRLNAAY